MDATTETDEAIVRAMAQGDKGALARAFDVTVVGEGVETEEQLEALAATGCDVAQGFLLGRPMSAAAITDLLLSSQ